MTFLRLNRGEAIAAVAALALLLFMAMDWYSTEAGELARQAEQRADPETASPLAREGLREAQEDARAEAEQAERNAWQVAGLGGERESWVDLVIFVMLLASAAVAMAAATLRAAGRRLPGPYRPSELAAWVALATAVLVTFRIVQEPGLNASTTVRAGAPLALLALAAVVIGSRMSVRADLEGPPEPQGEDGGGGGLPPPDGEPSPGAPAADDGRPERVPERA